MKTLLWSLLLVAGSVSAQVVPTTPTKFTKRTIGGGSGSADIGITPQPKPEPVVKMTSYISLSEPRQWMSADGRFVIGKLIAFEDMVIETTRAAAATAQPQMPALTGKPTVIKEGKVRVLVNQKPVEIPLERLAAKDREYAESIRDRVAQSPVPAPPVQK